MSHFTRNTEFVRATARRGWQPMLLVGLLLFVPSLATAGEMLRDAIAVEFQKVAPQLRDAMHGQGWRKMGVLKFRVQMNKGVPTDNIGSFNFLVARRLELALNLAPLNPATEVRLVRDASAVAATIPGASHLSKDGRATLFKADYPVSWGKPGEKINVDGFLTGLAEVDMKAGTIRIHIHAVHPDPTGIQYLWKSAPIELDWNLLPELGLGFASRGTGDQPAAAVTAAAEAAARNQPNPANDPDKAQISILVFYDGKPINIGWHDGQLMVPEPQQGEKVTFLLRRSDKMPMHLGVVLKVNGENTAKIGQFHASYDCTKWVLNPGNSQVLVGGYQVNKDQRRDFRVASVEESRALEMRYGLHTGLVSLEVFQETLAADIPLAPVVKVNPPDTQDDLAVPDVEVIQRGEPFLLTPPSPDKLQEQIRETAAARIAPKGAMTDGEVANQEVIEVDIPFGPQPVISYVFRYYRPQGAN